MTEDFNLLCIISLVWTLDHPWHLNILYISGQWSLYKTSVKGVCRILSGWGQFFLTFSIGGWILPRIHSFAFTGGVGGCSATAPVPCARPWILCPRGAGLSWIWLNTLYYQNKIQNFNKFSFKHFLFWHRVTVQTACWTWHEFTKCPYMYKNIFGNLCICP